MSSGYVFPKCVPVLSFWGGSLHRRMSRRVSCFRWYTCLLDFSSEYVIRICVPGLSFPGCSLWCRMSRRVSFFYGLVCLLDLSSGFSEEGYLCCKMSHGVSFFCQQVLLLVMSFVYVFPRSLPSLWNFSRGFLIPLPGFVFLRLASRFVIFIYLLCLSSGYVFPN